MAVDLKRLEQINKRFRRFMPMPVAKSGDLIHKVEAWIASDDHTYYMGFGGIGDFVILLAACWNDDKARILFFSNPHSTELIKEFIQLFKKNALVLNNIMGSKVANTVYEMIKRKPTFRTSGHLADRLDYGDWINENKYKERIISSAPWTELLGKVETDKKILILAPSGSERTALKQRYLNRNEHKDIIRKYLDLNYMVYNIGSESDCAYYGLPDSCYWMSSKKITSKKETKAINLKEMLQIINSAAKVISMDTWLKTYTLISNIPTIVVKTRHGNKYQKYGEDVNDYIFLNKNIWSNINMMTIEEILKQ